MSAQWHICKKRCLFFILIHPARFMPGLQSFHMKHFITTETAEFIATIDVVESKSCRCDCGESYAIVTDAGEMVICDACAEFYNGKNIK